MVSTVIDQFISSLGQLLVKSGSKWGGGIGLLWRGNSSSLYHNALKSVIFNRQDSSEISESNFLFESSRVAIYQYAKSIGLCAEDGVQILGFTCDAVTDAIKPFGSKISLYDCDSGLRSHKFTLMDDTKLLICQVTFGVSALSEDVLALAASRDVKILLDKSLSYGTHDFSATNACKYPQVFSFEVSKSFTIGWGGMLRMPEEMTAEFSQHYRTLDAVTLWDDLGRVMRATLNLFMVRHGGIFSYCLWIALRVLGLHRLSARSSLPKYHGRSIIGHVSKRIFCRLVVDIPRLLEISNSHHTRLKEALEGVGYPVISYTDSTVSTPRVAFLVHESEKSDLERLFSERGVELGFWFDSLPLSEKEIGATNLTGCQELMKSVVNLPCHWTLTEEELQTMLTCIERLSLGRKGLN